MPTKAPGVFFHKRVLPETKCFESAFSLMKVERGRAMELPFLKRRGHPNVTPSPKSFSHQKQRGSCSVPAGSAGRAAPFPQGIRVFRRSCASDSAALLVQLRAIVRPGLGGPSVPQLPGSPARYCLLCAPDSQGISSLTAHRPDSPVLNKPDTSSEIETVRKLVVSPRNHSLGFFFSCCLLGVFLLFFFKQTSALEQEILTLICVRWLCREVSCS